MDETEIIERIDKFFDKEGLDIQSKFILTKKISEEYWEEVLGEGEQNDDDLLGELGEEEPEEPTEPEEDIAAPTPEKKTTKNKITIKKPKVTTKKEETPKEPEEPEKDDTI